MSRVVVLTVALVLAGVGAASAVDSLEVVVAAPLERVWAAAARGLAADGWSIDHAERLTGTLVTESQRLAGAAGGIHVGTRRVRLRLRITALGPDRTLIAVGRELFERERLLWLERDTHVVAADALVPPHLERRAVAAIRQAL